MTTNRQIRADAFYRIKMVEAMKGLLLVANPQDQLSWPQKFDELVEYTLDILKTEQTEVIDSHIEIQFPRTEVRKGLGLEE